ncbi:MAG: hypothetical protein ACJ71K_15755, partial [Nitrososphaeraceae archaeon]
MLIAVTLRELCTLIGKTEFMRKIILLLSALILFAFTSNAQNIKGNVKDGDGKSVSNASVSLLSAKDSSVVKLAV